MIPTRPTRILHRATGDTLAIVVTDHPEHFVDAVASHLAARLGIHCDAARALIDYELHDDEIWPDMPATIALEIVGAFRADETRAA